VIQEFLLGEEPGRPPAEDQEDCHFREEVPFGFYASLIKEILRLHFVPLPESVRDRQDDINVIKI